MEVLTYNFDGDSLLPGQIVLVPLSKRLVPGIVVKKVAQPNFKTRSISKILYSKPLPSHLLKTVQFMHDYYMAPTGLMASLILPTGVEKKRRTRPNKTEQDPSSKSYLTTVNNLRTGPVLASSPMSQRSMGGSQARPPVRGAVAPIDAPAVSIPLNPAQKMALEGLQKGLEGTGLLFGVTGSGKTNIYLRMALNAFKRQKSIILLVPEIALTSQLVQVFKEVFGERVVLIHSKQTEAERHLVFEQILEAEEPLVVVGPRSALFAPVRDLGLIVIDEEHENT